MIGPITAITSSANHHYGAVTTTPVTPEGQVVTTLKIAAAGRLAEAHCGGITSPEVRITGSSACVAVPHSTIPKITKTCDKVSESVPTGAATGVQQGCVRAVITAGYFDVTALNEPECG